MSSQIQNSASKNVATLIKNELRRETNTRFLRGMPAFRADEEIPEKFKRLLAQLESAEMPNRRG